MQRLLYLKCNPWFVSPLWRSQGRCGVWRWGESHSVRTLWILEVSAGGVQDQVVPPLPGMWKKMWESVSFTSTPHYYTLRNRWWIRYSGAQHITAFLLPPLWHSVQWKRKAGRTYENPHQGQALLMSWLWKEVHQRELHTNSSAHPYWGETIPLLPVRQRFPHSFVPQAAWDAALRGETVRMLHLREDISDKLVPNSTLPDPH